MAYENAVSVPRAAWELGISSAQLRKLIELRVIAAQPGPNGRWMVDAESVARAKAQREQAPQVA